MIAYAWDYRSLLVIGAVIVIGMVLAYRLMHRDTSIWRTRYGFFVERDKYGDDHEVEPYYHESDDQETEVWPQQREEDV